MTLAPKYSKSINYNVNECLQLIWFKKIIIKIKKESEAELMLLPLELKIPEFSNAIIWTPNILEVPT